MIVSFEPTALKLNGTLMGSELEFATRLAQVMGTRRDKSVLFTAAPDVMHGKVVHVMAKRMFDLSHLLSGYQISSRDFH